MEQLKLILTQELGLGVENMKSKTLELFVELLNVGLVLKMDVWCPKIFVF